MDTTQKLELINQVAEEVIGLDEIKDKLEKIFP